jgi:D-glycero-alpha-D-manno-heptose-7-phosphate kinase
MIKEEGSVRIDLLGGTLDLEPINLILKDVYTLNLATSLKAEVNIEKTDFDGVEIISLDYDSQTKFSVKDFTEEKLRGDFFGPLRFVATILFHLNCVTNIKMTLKSGSPAGAGLGGSSSMGVTLYKAVAKYKGEVHTREDIIAEVKKIEAKDLVCGPTGYQDYYPALYGGVLALKPGIAGVEVEQLYSDELKSYIEDHVTLVFSGQTRLSGINNWEVYKSFFDGDAKTKQGLQAIADLSYKALLAIKSNEYDKFLSYIKEEGSERTKLFPGILTDEMMLFLEEAKKINTDVGMKVCGAGGGGCFIVIHPPEVSKKLESLIEKSKMTKLSFRVDRPLS